MTARCKDTGYILIDNKTALNLPVPGAEADRKTFREQSNHPGLPPEDLRELYHRQDPYFKGYAAMRETIPRKLSNRRVVSSLR